jgi:hypothetical protein
MKPFFFRKKTYMNAYVPPCLLILSHRGPFHNCMCIRFEEDGSYFLLLHGRYSISHLLELAHQELNTPGFFSNNLSKTRLYPTS